MPRRPRYAPPGSIFHVVNRGVERRRLFVQPADYETFVRLLSRGKARWNIKVLGVCIMPNHYHLLLQPLANRALSAYMHWVQGCYACDLRARTDSKGHGHVFQQRFWSGVVSDDVQLVAALKYIEANPREGQLVGTAEEWPWSSLAMRADAHSLLDKLPIELPSNWTQFVNAEGDSPRL